MECTGRSLVGRIRAVLAATHAAVFTASYVRGLRRIYPAVSFAGAPLALPLRLVLKIVENASSVLYIVLPLADEAVAAGPELRAAALHLSSFEFAVVDGLVRPSHLSFAFHIVVFKLAFIESARVREVVLAESVELTVNEVTFVVSTFELKPAFPGLFALDEFASKLNLIVIPRFRAVSMLLIVLPHTFIHGPVGVDKYAHAVGFSVYPLALVDVAICMSHTAFAIELLVLGHALVCGSVGELDYSYAFPDGRVGNFDIRFSSLILIFGHHRTYARGSPLTLVHFLGHALTCVSSAVQADHVTNWLEVVDPYKVLASVF